MFAPLQEDGEFVNCFVRYVVDYLRNKMTRAGSGLTPKRRRILDRFDNKLRDVGCTREDMFDLERCLKVKLVAFDALGHSLWDSGKYNTHTKIAVPCHNNHAWASIPTDPPKVLQVHGLDHIAENALSALSARLTDRVAQKTEDQRTREVLLAFAARAIPSTVRMWLCGQALVGSDGSLWRSRSAEQAIATAFTKETGADPRDDLPEELEREYHQATHSMGGATAYRFRKWLDREEIKPTPERHRDVWQAAQVEAKVWNSSDKSAGSSNHHHLDMRAAYLACEESLLGGVGDAIDLVHEYGFPTSMMRRANVEGVPLSNVLSLTGAVQLSAWRFSPNVHPFTVGRVGEHLRENKGWVTTPELRDLLDAGDLVEATASEVLYSVGTKPGIKFPFDRDLVVRFIGKCARHGDESSILVRDPNEAAYLTRVLCGTDRLLNFEKTAGVHLIQYKDGKTRTQWFHIRAFVLAYTNIALRRMLRRFPQEDILRVCTDALYVKTIPESVAECGMLVEDHPRYGHWRHKQPGYEWRPEVAGWKIEHIGDICALEDGCLHRHSPPTYLLRRRGVCI
jgi:hypothetical protein